MNKLYGLILPFLMVIWGGLGLNAQTYCTPQGTNSARFINNFSTTGGIQNITNNGSGFSTGGYGDFTSLIVSQEINGTVNFSADISGGTAGIRIWVDWNQDGTFHIVDEVAYQSNGYSSSHSGSFVVPIGALAGQTRMRVVSHWLSTTGNIDPCATGFTYGEFEDYTFVVESGPCASSVQMNCGQIYTANLVTNSGDWSNYTGTGFTYTGSEQVWSFTAPVTGPYTFNVNQGTADADFFLMDACSNTAGNLSSGYWTGSSPGTSHTVTLTEGVTYYLIADLYSGASSATTVTVSVDCPPACPPDMIINTTTYSNTGLTTCGFGNDFSSSDACGSNYMGGEDIVIAYTPTTSGCVNIALTNTGTWTGVFVLDNCPNIAGANCLANNTNSSGNPSINGFSVTAGSTYYIVVSTWPSPNCTAFDLNITSCSPNPSNDIIPTVCTNQTFTLQAGSSLHFYDDGGPGGNCSTNGAPGNFANAGCETITTICAAPGEYLIADFFVFSMFTTESGFDWMVIYDGPNTSSPILFDNRAGAPDNPIGTSCTYNGGLTPCATGRCLTFRFNGTSTVNREGWDALITSTPVQCSPLPVELSHFSANCDKHVIISWATESELNSEKFIVEKSRNGAHWEVVDEVGAAGNSNSHLAYLITDYNRYDGTSYYRLRQVDFDGKEEVFGPVSVNCESVDNSIIAYPNPSNGDFTVEINSSVEINDAVIQLADMTGKIVSSQVVQVANGVSQISIEKSEYLTRGTYVLKVLNAGEYFNPVKIVVK